MRCQIFLIDRLRSELLAALVHIRIDLLDSLSSDDYTRRKFKDLLKMTDEELIKEYGEAVDVNDALLVACWAQQTDVW